MKETVAIMSTYNGGRYLKEQIDSILNQKGVDIRLVVRDDGSTDSTPEILARYASARPDITVIGGNNVGCKASFYQAAQFAYANLPDAMYFAFADQDDFWMPEKLSKGVSEIEAAGTGPTLYFCQPTIVDSTLHPLDIHWNNTHFLNFEEACLAQPCAGCTMIFNREALRLFLMGDPNVMSLHDSWIYKCVLACGGKVIEDRESFILYRQHGDNVVGTQSFSDRWKRRYKMFTSKSCYRSGQARAILSTYSGLMPEHCKNVASDLSTYQTKGLIEKLRIAFGDKYKTKSKINNLLFAVTILFNRF